MLPSNSRFQRLSQAALSRSQFLQLAAGALLGFPPSAAAAPSSDLAQNGGEPGTKDAAASDRMGAILVSQFGPVKIHSYLSPLDGFHVNTQMIEGPTAVVIFDGQLLLSYADEVASYVQTLGKPIERIILSHAHTDHWSGLQVLTERFPDTRVFALDGIADQLRARGQARLDSFRPIYGDRIATKVTVPTEIIAEGVQRIDGITYDFRRFVDAESDLQLAALLPEQKVLMAFDLVFSPNEHAFTVVDHFDHWTIVLEQLKALQDYDTITIGHDTPVHRSAIDSTITYVKRAREIHAVSADAKTYSESLKPLSPTGSWPAWSISRPNFFTPRVVEQREPEGLGRRLGQDFRLWCTDLSIIHVPRKKNETLRPKDRHQHETSAHFLGRKGPEAADRRGGHAEGREQGSGISIQKSYGNDASPRTR